MNDQHPAIHCNRRRLVRALGVLAAGVVMVVTADPPVQNSAATGAVSTPATARDLAGNRRSDIFGGDDNVRVYRF